MTSQLLSHKNPKQEKLKKKTFYITLVLEDLIFAYTYLDRGPSASPASHVEETLLRM